MVTTSARKDCRRQRTERNALIATGLAGYAIAAGVLVLLCLSDPDGLGHVLPVVGGPAVIGLLYLFLGSLFALALLTTSMSGTPGARRPGRPRRTGRAAALALQCAAMSEAHRLRNGWSVRRQERPATATRRSVADR